MRRCMFAALILAICFGSALADRKKTSNAPDTAPMPIDSDVLVQAVHKRSPPLTLPPPHYLGEHLPHYFPEEPGIPQRGELASQEWKPSPDSKAMTKVFAVADLVVPLPVVCTDGDLVKELPKTLENELIARIKSHVEPKSWTGSGGKGTISYFPTGMALVVSQESKVLEAIERFLDSERRIQDRQVILDVFFLTVSDEWFEKSGLQKALPIDVATGTTPTKVMNSQNLERLLKAAQEDRATNVMQSPRITCLSGQPGRMKMCEVEHFLTGLRVNSVDGNLVYEPKNEPHELGTSFSIKPTVAEDGKSVRLAVEGSVREVSTRPVPMTPFTTMVKSLPQKGSPEGKAVPFTHHIQEPKILNRKVTGTPTVPDGGTALFYGGKATIQDLVKESVPMLADVPGLAELFTEQKKVTRTNHLLVLVTTRIVSPEQPEPECLKLVGHDTSLSKLVGEYSMACQEGKKDEARRLAIECLAIDPTCFGKR